MHFHIDLGGFYVIFVSGFQYLPVYFYSANTAWKTDAEYVIISFEIQSHFLFLDMLLDLC